MNNLKDWDFLGFILIWVLVILVIFLMIFGCLEYKLEEYELFIFGKVFKDLLVF